MTLGPGIGFWRRNPTGGAPPLLLQQAFDAGDTGFWYRPTDPTTMRTAAPAVPNVGDSVVTLLDQSGGGHNGTLATAAKYQVAGNNRGVLQFTGTEHIDVPTSISFDRRAMTLFVVVNQEANSLTMGLFNTPPAATTTLGLHPGTTATKNGGQLTSFPGFSPASGVFQANRSTRVLAVVYSATERRVFDGRQEVTGTAASVAAATAGAFLMRWNTSLSDKARGLLHEYAVVRRAMSASEVQAIVDELNELHGGYDRQSKLAILTIGDSLSAGVFTLPGDRTNLEYGQHYGQWIAEKYPAGRRPKVSCFADGGAHIRVIRDTQIAAMNTELQRFKDAGYTQIALLVAGGTNDANGPTSGYPSAATGTDLINVFTDIYNGITVTGTTLFAKTVPPRGTFNPGWDTATDALNAWLTGGSSPYGSRIINDRADPRIANPNNPAYYISDLLHFTGGPSGGHDAMGEISYNALIAAGMTGI